MTGYAGGCALEDTAVNNFGDKAIGFFCGVSIAAITCALLIFTDNPVSWFELVKSLSAILVSGALIISTATYVRQGKWKVHEDNLEDSKIFMDAAIQGIQHASKMAMQSTKGVDWHAATIYFEQSQIVAKNITSTSIISVFNLRKSVYLNEVLTKVHALEEHAFSNLTKAEYSKIRKIVRVLSSQNVSGSTSVEKDTMRQELTAHADSLMGSEAIDFSSVVEMCIGIGLIEHEEVFEEKFLKVSPTEISPDYMIDEVVESARKFLSNRYSSSPIYYYSETIFLLSRVLSILEVDRRDQLIGN